MDRLPNDHPAPFEDLTPPRIYDAEANGGLGYAAVGPGATRKISVVVSPWSLFQDGDQIRVLAGPADTVLGRKDVDESYAFKSFTIEVEPADIRPLGDGLHDFKFQVQGALGNKATSGPRRIEIKTTPPGGLDPDPATATVNENLAPPIVVPSPLGTDLSNVKVVVVRWDVGARSEVARGDRLVVYWHGVPVEFPPLTDEQAKLNDFQVSIPEQIIREAGGGDVVIRYAIKDRVGNYSWFSRDRIEDVPIENPDQPQAPWVEGTKDNAGSVLRLVDVGNAPVEVLAENHTGKKDDEIRVVWTGTAAGEKPTPPFITGWKTLPRDGVTLEFEIPNAEVLPLGEGRVVVTYELKPVTGSVRVSRRRNLQVEGLPAKLTDPLVSRVENGVLDAAKNKSGAVLTARHQPALIPRNSQVVFEWQGKITGSDSIYADGSNDTLGNLPYGDILRLAGDKVRIRYVVQSSAGPLGMLATQPQADNESDWIELDVIDSEASLTAPPPIVEQAPNKRIDPLAVTTITVRMPFTFQAGDTATVTWTGNTNDGSDTYENGFPSQDPTVTVPISILAFSLASWVDVSYVVHRGSQIISSETTTLMVEAISGDQRLPRPRSVQENPDGTLDLAKFANDAEFYVEPWPLASPRQRYWLTVTDQDDSGKVDWRLAEDEEFTSVQGPRVALATLSRSRLESLTDNYRLKAILDVTFDRSRDKSHAVRFRLTNLTVRQAAASRPPAPEIVQADGNSAISEPWKLTKLQVRIPNSVVFQPGDQLKVQWNPGNGNASDEQIIPNPTTGQTVDMRIAVLAHNMGSTVPVKYVIVRSPTNPESIATNVTIGKFSDGHKDLPRPQSPQQDNTGRILDMSQFVGDAQIDIDAYPMIAVGQRYWLTVAGTFAGGNNTEVELVKGDTIPFNGPGKMKIGTMDRTWLGSLRGNSNINIKLWVSFDGSTHKQDAVLFRETDYTLQLMKQIKFEMPEVVRATDDNGDGIKESLAPEVLVDGNGAVHRIQVKLAATNPFIEGDAITVEWKGDSSNGSAIAKVTVQKADVGKDIEVLIPYDVIRFNHGKRVEVSFSLVRNGVTLQSPILRLEVKRIPNQSTIWSRGRILQEDAVLREIVLSTFTGDADLYTEPFPFVVSGMYFWIRAQSKDNQGDTNHYVEGTINSTTGKISLKTLPRTWLNTLRDNQSLTISLKVTFDGSKDERDAVVFRTSQYTFLKTKPGT